MIFCVIISAVFMTLIASTTHVLNRQFDRVQDDYRRAQAITAAEAGVGHAHAIMEISKSPLDVALPYGTKYKVGFTLCSTAGNQNLWSITSSGWSIDKRLVWTIQQNILETLPGGLCSPVHGSWTLSSGLIVTASCP